MKPNFTLLMTAMLLMASNLYAQFANPDIEDYGPPSEKYLGYPNTNEGTQLIPLGIDLWEGDEVNTIHYGQVPAKSSDKPVMVFVHGYASNAQVWFKGDDNMYWDVFKNGYRSAFVSLTPNRHMWTNGSMLATMIDKITEHYGVEKVVLVGWSKGGVDIDAALTHFNASNKVSQVFTLSTPHYGTGIAELANNILLSLVNIIFMQDNDATLCLQRGYMNYFRSLTDNHANNDVDYVTLGGHGNDPLARLAVPQGYLYLAGGSKSSGGNDGVVPYQSTRRPGGLELYSGLKKKHFLGIPYYTGPNETDLDHYEVTRGGLVWPYIQANIKSKARAAFQTTSLAYNPNSSVSSSMQLITSSKGSGHFSVEENAGVVTLVLAQKGNPKNLRINDGNGFDISPKSEITARNTEAVITYDLGNLNPGTYNIASSGQFAAAIITENGIEATLNTGLKDKLVYEQGEAVSLGLKLNSADGKVIDKALVTGTMTRTSDLNLNPIDENPHLVSFEKGENGFHATIDKPLPSGVYNITVTAKGESFTKNVIASIAVTGSDELIKFEQENLRITTYPNPFRGRLNIWLDVRNDNAELAIYNVFGQQVKKIKLEKIEGRIQVEWSPDENTTEGIYIIQLTDGSNKYTQKVILE